MLEQPTRHRGASRAWFHFACAGAAVAACSGRDAAPAAGAAGHHDAAKPALGVELRGWFADRAPVAAAEPPMRRRYHVELEAELSGAAPDGGVGAPVNPGGPAPVPEGELRGSKLAVSGTWSITPVGPDGNGSRVLAELAVDALDLTAPASPLVSAADYRARVRSDLARPLLLRLDERGRVVELKADLRMIGPGFAVLRSVAAAAQLTSGAAWESAWSADEQDAGGRYRARYERTGARSFRKQKLAYTARAPGDVPDAAAAQIVGSTGELRAAPDGTLVSATIRDELVVDPGSGLPPLRSVATYRFAHLGDELVPWPDDRLAALEPLAWRAIDQPPPPEASELDLDLTKVAGYTRVADVVAELDRLDVAKIPGDADRQKRLQIALSALFRLSGAAVREAARALERHDRHAEVLLRALALAGPPAAQQLALERVEHPGPLSRAARREILVALSWTRHPSAALVDGLERLTADPGLHGQALLGLGSAAFRVQHEDPALARRILGLLRSHLEVAHAQGSFQAAEVALLAFGNAGDPEMIAMLEPYFTAPQPPIRVAALRALRRVDSPEVDRLLTAYASRDLDDGVRGAARTTLEKRARGHRQATD